MFVRVIGGHGGVGPGYRATSYLIDGKLLIDCGSVASGIPVEEQIQIDHILISHAHLDHICELAYMSDNCFGLKGKAFEIYANAPVLGAIQTHLMNDILWPDFSKIPSSKNPTVRFNNLKPEETFQLGEYQVTPILVNHPGGACGFLIEAQGKSLIFTQDTGPTDKIWQYAKKASNLKGIFCEVSFPMALASVARDSFHHSPQTIQEEIKKMPEGVPIFLGHLKPNFQFQLYKEIEALGEPRITILGQDGTTFQF